MNEEFIGWGVTVAVISGLGLLAIFAISQAA